jgi:uncharacterized damage-inducible protein DinB
LYAAGSGCQRLSSRGLKPPAYDVRVGATAELIFAFYSLTLVAAQEGLMYRRLDDFTKNWKGETDSTVKVFRQLTDASLGQKVSPEGRTLGYLAWHITTSIPEMMNRTGLTVAGAQHGPAPATAAELVAAYETAATSLLEQVQSRWTDASLDEVHEMYGETWANGFTVAALLGHQTHHRGQMTVLMRQAGLAVPGVYGPSREEWVAYGMPAQE